MVFLILGLTVVAVLSLTALSLYLEQQKNDHFSLFCALRRLQRQVEARSESRSICSAIDKRHHKRLRKLWRKWERFSGDDFFPVPSPTPHLESPCEAFLAADDILDYWYGAYGENRKELLQFLIDQISEGLWPKHKSEVYDHESQH